MSTQLIIPNYLVVTGRHKFEISRGLNFFTFLFHNYLNGSLLVWIISLCNL